MTQSIKTTCLETSKLLKEAGLMQYVYPGYFWTNNPKFKYDEQEFYRVYLDYIHEQINDDFLYYKSPTTDELLEELPYQIKQMGERLYYKLHISKYDNFYTVRYEVPGACCKLVKEESLSEALASMYLWLKKEGLL